jgi:C-5 cytosine-specific DNA methylase
VPRFPRRLRGDAGRAPSKQVPVRALIDVTKPLCIDLFCGLGGWTEGLLAEGWDVVGFDIKCHVYGDARYPAQLVLQDVLTLTGRQFRGHASLIVASPPCQEFSYMAMPWQRAKQIARALRDDSVHFPRGYNGSLMIRELTQLFDACFRIASEAQCPIVVENVKGAEPWVGRAKAHFGSFYLWGDVAQVGRRITAGGMRFGDTLRPGAGTKKNTHGVTYPNSSWFAVSNSGVKQHGSGATWFDEGICAVSSSSPARKAASAQIAKIPPPLARYIARAFMPR